MSFFDSKEEVLNIELTSYGKLLLSKGILKPAYYSFHDDDILYDVEAGGLTENASFAEVRIQEQTPYLKPFYSFSSPESSLQKAIDQDNWLNNINNSSKYKVDYFYNALGDSTISNLYVPSWKINNLSTNFTSIQNTFGDNLRIPQLNCVLTSSLYKAPEALVEASPTLSSIIDFDNTFSLGDGIIYFSQQDTLTLKIEEENVDVDVNKFDVEVYRIDTDADSVETYVLMKFVKDIEFVDQNNILQDIKLNFGNTIYDNTYIEASLDIRFDKSIETRTVCKHILKNEQDQDQIYETIDLCSNEKQRYSTTELYKILVDNATGKVC